MRIRYHVAVNNRLQRSIVELENHTLARRIVHLVRQEDGSPCDDLPTPLWQEQTHWGVYHTVCNPGRAAELEREFIMLLIAQKDSPAPCNPACAAEVEREFIKPSRQPANT